ncbi:MAG: hypothetical protein NTU73_11460 [Ignavibacteriae bacterium]|nr:hypothetical protein [Ignavibacteriota bacterium]
MKKLFLPILFSATFSLFIFSSCTKDNSPVAPPPGTTGTQNTLVRTSTNGGTLAFDSYSMTILPGTVPKTTSGGNGTVTFSIETKTTLDSLVTPLPSGYTLVGKYVKFGPDGFIFSHPIKMSFPASTESSPELLVVMRYYPESNQWLRVNTSKIDTVNKIISTDGDGPRLGYFALVKAPAVPKNNLGTESSGGIEFSGEPNYWYTLTVASCTLKYPYQGAWFSGGSPVGHTFSSGSDPTGNNPLSPMHAYLPQGTYSIWVSRRTYSGNLYTYSYPYTCNITSALVYLGWSSPTNWAHMTDPGGGTWVIGAPTNWPLPTVPMGTGLFQSTLTWVNTSSSAVDLDLYLTLPNNDKVWYGHKIANDSSYGLDVDFRYTLGNATENIYSLKNTLPAGNYKVEVNYWGGSGTKPFNVRILINGSVTNHSGSLSSGTALIRTFTL